LTITVRYEPMDRVRISAETMLPRTFTVTYDADNLPLIEIDMAVVDGVPVCDAVSIKRRANGASLTGTELRRVPIAETIDFATAKIALRRVETLADGSQAWEPPDDDLEGQRLARQDVGTALRRRAITDELLREVSRVYRLNPDSPTKAVGEAFVVGSAQASRYVKQARLRGFLEERK
jgi:hypothetical protein